MKLSVVIFMGVVPVAGFGAGGDFASLGRILPVLAFGVSLAVAILM
jgi:hypothetical protein